MRININKKINITLHMFNSFTLLNRSFKHKKEIFVILFKGFIIRHKIFYIYYNIIQYNAA